MQNLLYHCQRLRCVVKPNSRFSNTKIYLNVHSNAWNVPFPPDNFVSICDIRALSKTDVRTTGHVDDEISIFLIIKYIFTAFVAFTCSSWERVDCTLRQEPNTTANEGLTGIHMFLLLTKLHLRMYKCILFLMIPFHMPMINLRHRRLLHLFIKDRIPPHI